MKLLTAALENKFKKYPLYSQDGKGDDAEVICKFFAPVGSFTWYVTEGERQGDDFMFFGVVASDYGKEYGYFSLKELQELRLPFGLGIERDLHFKPCAVSKILS